ncbi:MAG: hypothetical protein IKM34_04130 [Clostridia bacterium]|nr:hypothetical protein [Clostridia bacterium]
MKKSSFPILLLLVFLLLTACQNENVATSKKASPNEPQTISIQTDERDRTYVILPISNEEIRCDKQEIALLENLSYAALKNAEEKLIEKTKAYSHPYLYFNTEDNSLCLCAEFIVKIDPATETAPCGDHKHLMFSEPLTE